MARELEAHGYTVYAWDRRANPPEDLERGRAFLDRIRPDRFYHFGLGSAEWAGFLAEACARRRIPFLNTSTVSVYADREIGPITPETEPDNTSEYALYKLESERLVRAAYPDAVIARIGWQIGSGPGSNNLLDYLHRQAEELGAIDASTRWFPACSFIEDTAIILHRLLEDQRPGTYLVDGNVGMNFYEIASGLNRLHGSPWLVRPTDDFVLDLRMVDPRLEVLSVERRLPPDG
jgi:dTDP-4-dehydrorhamnose reductase